MESRVPDELGEVHLQIYRDLINSATADLQLQNWPDFTAGATVHTIPNSFVDGVGRFGVAVAAANWPGRFPALEVELKNLSRRAEAFIDMYLARAAPDTHTGNWRRDNQWKRRWRADYEEELEKVRVWERQCDRLLMNLTTAVNRFADAVRQSVQPTYLLSLGRFHVVDFMGVLSDLQPTAYFPQDYDDSELVPPNQLVVTL